MSHLGPIRCVALVSMQGGDCVIPQLFMAFFEHRSTNCINIIIPAPTYYIRDVCLLVAFYIFVKSITTRKRSIDLLFINQLLLLK